MLGGSLNIVGGTDPGAGNLISGFTHSGVLLAESKSPSQGNLIGTDVDRDQAAGESNWRDTSQRLQ